jgi:hypothetical protein
MTIVPPFNSSLGQFNSEPEGTAPKLPSGINNLEAKL